MDDENVWGSENYPTLSLGIRKELQISQIFNLYASVKGITTFYNFLFNPNLGVGINFSKNRIDLFFNTFSDFDEEPSFGFGIGYCYHF